MKKTVVVNMEYMRPSVSGRSRSRSRSRTRSESQPNSRSRTQSPQTTVNRIVTSAIEQSALCDDYDYDELLNDKVLLVNEVYCCEDDDDEHDEDEESGSNDDNNDEDITSASESSTTSSYTCDTKKQYQHPSIKDSDYAVDSDEDLFQSVLDEPTFQLDVNAILSAMTKTENSTIANMTLPKIAARRQEVLASMNLSPEKLEEFERKLHLYRVIERPDELKHNQLIRWIPLRSLETRPYVTLGGCLFRVKYNEKESLHIVTIRNVKKFVFNIKFELNAVFQRLSQEELLILRAVEYVESED
jgi:hypothetical protein